MVDDDCTYTCDGMSWGLVSNVKSDQSKFTWASRELIESSRSTKDPRPLPHRDRVSLGIRVIDQPRGGGGLLSRLT